MFLRDFNFDSKNLLYTYWILPRANHHRHHVSEIGAWFYLKYFFLHAVRPASSSGVICFTATIYRVPFVPHFRIFYGNNITNSQHIRNDRKSLPPPTAHTFSAVTHNPMPWSGCESTNTVENTDLVFSRQKRKRLAPTPTMVLTGTSSVTTVTFPANQWHDTDLVVFVCGKKGFVISLLLIFLHSRIQGISEFRLWPRVNSSVRGFSQVKAIWIRQILHRSSFLNGRCEVFIFAKRYLKFLFCKKKIDILAPRQIILNSIRKF